MSTELAANRYFERGAAITAADTPSQFSASAVYVGGTGNVSVYDVGGNIVTFTGALAGTLLPVLCTGVRATGLTASALVRCF